jgi:hypothetical protein
MCILSGSLNNGAELDDRTSQNRTFKTQLDSRPSGTDSRQQIHVVGGNQIRPIPGARETWLANHRLAGRRYSLSYRSRYRDGKRTMNRPVPKLVASSTVECIWPSFDAAKLPLSQPARHQLSRGYSDIRNYPAVARRKSGLLSWIQSSAYDPVKGIHVPVSETVKTSAADALERYPSGLNRIGIPESGNF